MKLAPRILLAASLFLSSSNALKFDLQAHQGSESASKERCIRNFAGRDTLVVVAGAYIVLTLMLLRRLMARQQLLVDRKAMDRS